MGKLIAVQGCLIQCKTAGVTVANFQITTPPVTTVLADNKPVYAGTLSVLATGVTMSGFTCPTATFTILPSTAFATANNQFLVVEGDNGLCTCTGTNSQGATTAITFSAEIVQAGQTGVELDVSEGGGDLSLVYEQIQGLNSTISKLKGDLDETNSELEKSKAEITATSQELANTTRALNETQSALSNTQAELSSTKTELNNTKSALSQTNSQLESTKGDVTTLNSTLSKTNQELEQAKVSISNTTTELATQKEGLKAVNAELTTTKNSIPTKSQIQGYVNDMDTINANLNGDIITPNRGGSESAGHFIVIPRVYYTLIDPTHDTPVYMKALLKWICQNYPNTKNALMVTLAHPNSQGFALIQIYDTSIVNSEGLPQYGTIVYVSIGGHIRTFGTYDFSFFERTYVSNTTNAETYSEYVDPQEPLVP